MAFDLRQKVFRIPSDMVVSVGLCWDFIGADPVDLDLSAVCFTKEGMLLDCVFFNHPFPVDTDDGALRSSGAVVDPRQLPYMFTSGDSRLGGEEENQLPGLALAARRRKYQLRNTSELELKRMGVMEAIFSRIYEEAELDGVEAALDEQRGGGELFDEDGRVLDHRRCCEFCDEFLTFVMHKIPSDVDVIFISVTSYTGADFTTLPNAKLVIMNETTRQCVGQIDIKQATRNGSACLACMLCRLPPSTNAAAAAAADPAEPQLWDLRELKIRTFGYTFVDMLPVMLDALGVDKHSRDDALQLLPDYPLTKESYSRMGQTLADVRFGIGWHGEHDLDAFMVMLDENNRYIDHLYSKQAKLHSAHPHAAHHSGDAISGFGTAGDVEFIDLVTYHMPLEVQTIIFGAIYVESFGSNAKDAVQGIFDVPKLYMRLQNRTMEWPNAFEVDRWNIHYEVAEGDEKEKEGKTTQRQGQSRTPRAYVGPDGKMHPSRMAVLGLMTKKCSSSFSELYPNERRRKEQTQQQQAQKQQLTKQNLDRGGGDQLVEEEVPLFEYHSLHEYTPASVVDSFSAVMPYLYAIAHYHRNRKNNNHNHNVNPGARMPWVLGINNNLPGWSLPATSAYLPSMWVEVNSSGNILTHHAVRVQFLEVRELSPILPHRFKCHGEAWVCDGLSSARRSLTACNMPPFRTPYLMHRDNTRWDDRNPATAGLFFVRKFDRIRVVIYEYASFGYVDLDLMQLPDLWCEEPSDSLNVNGGFNCVDRWFPLCGGTQKSGMLRLRLFRVETKEALGACKSIMEEKSKGRQRHAKLVAERRERCARKAYSSPCNLM